MRTLRAALFISLCLSAGACAYGYKRAADAAMSPLSAPAQAQDMRLKGDLRAMLVENDNFTTLRLTADVFMDRAFIVGFVDSREQAQDLIDAAKHVRGLRSLDTYLPVRPATDSSSSDLELKTKVRAAIVESPGLVGERYTVVALDGVVALLGVTMSEEERRTVEQVARSTSGVTDVKDFLLVVEEPYAALRPHLR